MKLLSQIIITALLLSVADVKAEIKQGAFIPPFERIDGIPLPQSEIGGYQVFVNGILQTDMLPGNATGFTLDLMPGIHSVYLITVDSDGRKSDPSVTIEIPVKSTASPKAPTAMRFIIDGTARQP